jgi:hypothetical protein
MANNEPADFSFLSAEERLFIARARLPRLHDYLWGIMVLEDHLHALVHFDIVGQISDVAARVGATTIQDLTRDTLLVETAGLWEKFDGAGFSLPTVCAALDHPSVLKLLEDDSALPPVTGEAGITLPIAGEREAAISALPACFAAVERVQRDKVLVKIRNYRNKYAAHPILATREERKQKSEIEFPTVGEVRELLSKATRFVRNIQLAAFGYTYDYDYLQELSRRAPLRLYAGLSFSPDLANDRLRAGAVSPALPSESSIRDL